MNTQVLARAARVELVEEVTGYLLACYRSDGSGELIWCADTGVLTDLDAINDLLAEHGCLIDAAPVFWQKHVVPSLLESIEFRGHMCSGEAYGDFEIRPRLRQGRSAREREMRDQIRTGAA